MDLDIQRCPRCSRILTAGACAFCANADRPAASMAPHGGSQHPPSASPSSWSQHPSTMPPDGRGARPPSIAPGPRSGHPSSSPPGRSQFPPPEDAQLRTAAARIATLRPPEIQRSPWWWRVGALLAIILLAGVAWTFLGARPEWRGLAVHVDGPEPSKAPTLLFFLHGEGATNGSVQWVAGSLRAAGVSSETSIAFVEGPYATGLQHHWGEDGGERARARERIRKAIDETIGASPVASQRVFIAGFSQGAQLAAELASLDQRIVGVVLISPCVHIPTDQLRSQDVLVAHGSGDEKCKAEMAEELVARLKKERIDVTYVPFEGGHVIAPEAVEAMGTFLAPVEK